MPRSLGTMTDKEIQDALDRGESLPGHAGTPSFVRLRPSRRPVKERQESLERRISNLSPEEKKATTEKLLQKGWRDVSAEPRPSGKQYRDSAEAISKLETALEKGKMNENLREAIKETVKALKQNDTELATDLTAVKSFIGSGNYKGTFVEDDEYNKKVLGDSLYGYLDWLHHELAFSLGQIPSGMMVMSASGVQQRPPGGTRQHPILKMMEEEDERIRKEAAQREPITGGDSIPNIKAAAERVAAAFEATHPKKKKVTYRSRQKEKYEIMRKRKVDWETAKKIQRQEGAAEVRAVTKTLTRAIKKIEKGTAEMKKKRLHLRKIRQLSSGKGPGWHRQFRRHSDVAIKAARSRARAPGKKFHMPKGLPTSYRRGSHISHVDLNRDRNILAKHIRKPTQPTWRGDVKGRRI